MPLSLMSFYNSSFACAHLACDLSGLGEAGYILRGIGP